MAGRVDWQKPKKLANIFTTGFDFSRHSASGFDLNSFSSVKTLSLPWNSRGTQGILSAVLELTLTSSGFPDNTNLSTTAMSGGYAPDIALGLLP